MISRDEFFSLFLPSKKYQDYILTFPKTSINDDLSFGLEMIKEEFLERVDNFSNYNLFIYSHFLESGVGKSMLALYLAEQLMKLRDFQLFFVPNFETFLVQQDIQNKSIYVIDDTTVSRIGMGSTRILEQFNEFLGISARYSQICFIFTTTLDIEKFAFLVNLHRLISIIGFNKELGLSLSYTYQKSIHQSEYFLTKLPSKKTLELYDIMKRNYVNSFKGGQRGNITIKLIVSAFDLESISQYNKKELEAIFSVKTNITISEIGKIVTLLKLKQKFMLPPSFYSEKEYLKHKEKINKNKEF